MDARQYLTEIKFKLIASPIVESFSIVEEKDLQDRGYFRARVTLTNSDFLEIAEYFVVIDDQPRPERYRYQWMDSTRKILRKRWDNVPHFPNLSNFPHQVHISAEDNVQASTPRGTIEFLAFLEAEILPSD
ncbi:toxin-antitoxin system TumE family protein [Phormidium tenue]|uniref:Uncharacterized protein n=1 Tax=Phormidium tenue NIES-30 TaxID=549789 RepID=A0A1U7J6X9_9CYAN|nr:DUF6516 family protein [Phormidium tenue]MBD2233602.1 hypothetical protein [Phormidium tenue FACHB-1052]OKH48702.1 hypothetical protein NIES30_09165 [Phormidium tenue NIES-30]